MKNKKLIVLSVAAVMVVCLSIVAFVACNGNQERYNYTNVKINVDSNVPGVGSMFSSMESAYDALYKNSYIEVADNKITWSLNQGNKNVLSVKKDGENYDLSNKETEDSLISALTSVGATNVEVTMIGRKTDDGFEIIMKVDCLLYGSPITMTLNFNFIKD